MAANYGASSQQVNIASAKRGVEGAKEERRNLSGGYINSEGISEGNKAVKEAEEYLRRVKPARNWENEVTSKK